MKPIFYGTVEIGSTSNDFNSIKWQRLLNALYDIYGDDDMDEALLAALNFGKLNDLNNLDIDIIIGTLEYFETIFVGLKKMIMKFIGER